MCGGVFAAAEGKLTMEATIDPDWRALEYVKANGLEQGVTLKRTELADLEGSEVMAETSPGVILGNACRRGEIGKSDDTTARAAMNAFVRSRANIVFMECQ